MICRFMAGVTFADTTSVYSVPLPGFGPGFAISSPVTIAVGEIRLTWRAKYWNFVDEILVYEIRLQTAVSGHYARFVPPYPNWCRLVRRRSPDLLTYPPG